MKQERTNLVGNHKIRNKLNKSEKMKSRKISTLKKHRTHNKSRNHERTSSSNLISKPINKMMAKTGSYDLTTSINSGNDVEEDVLNINDKIRLNSAEPIRDKTGGCESSSRNLYRFDNGFVKPDRRARNDEHSNNIPPASSSSPMFEFPKKKRFFGMPLTCFAYFAAIYSILAYGATSLLSLFEVMTNSSPRLIPLYILLVGYLLITLLTFVLIIAIQKELLNLILLWCIVMTVFILPEIGLNIMLAENTFNWFESTSGFYTLIALVVRVTLDVPCICLMLIYHHDRCKRVSLLRKIMMPLRKNISSGEILRSYNDIDQRQSVLKPPNMPPVPPAYKPERRESSRGSANAIGFEKISGENGTCNQDETLNRVHYKFAPNKHNYEIILRPSQTGEFVQKFVNIDDVKFGRDKELVMSEVPQKQQTHARKPITPIKDKEDALDGNSMIKKNENKHYILNDNEFKEKYINEITKKSRMINLANHQIYLPPMISSSSSLINNPKLANNFLPLNSESVNLDLTNDTSIDLNNNDSRAEYQSAALNVSPSCECVNIVSCDKEEASEFLHSQNCHMKAQQPPSSLFMFTQRKHF